MNRIEQKFQELKQQKRKAFIAFITAGDPDLSSTGKLVRALEEAGVDIIELGVPFSDPLADGPIIQASYHRALNHGTTVKKILETVKRLRRTTSIPLALMSSYNPIFHFGEQKFIESCVEAGVDGLIVPDLPPEEAVKLRRLAREYDVATVFFVAPTSTDDRIKSNTMAANGFVYYVSLTGTTGVQKAVASAVIRHVRHIKRFTPKPVCVGFGISTPQQVRAIARAADGIIVGSAIVKTIEAHRGRRDLLPSVKRYVSSLVKALR
ncbi:MAG: tryptophan synthase subunit alpha [Candidatus Omnitrophica bacterium]|nr:tryptophan synthase subunit alpha [Candidatus Omnitrophota bacterium]MDE2009056.1 tryptophan synthase subunit alpha [Candidatus Omnitrophota bacterium]MDE2214279.1 tryptophan synthase subunit alpha [Candidatus Omnitrophota bacterium]MDE2231316.1 tryptophan synthase subunit alpha [Candidatus Omnitrophota bacterium]